MNKTVTINISGLIFNIDELAYAKLKNYLSSIERYFTTSDGKEEIMTDIEGRIAEMFSDRISSRKEVVSMADVDHMISVMGQPEDFIDDETREENQRKNSKLKLHKKNITKRLVEISKAVQNDFIETLMAKFWVVFVQVLDITLA